MSTEDIVSAADKGWADVAEGRYVDIEDHDLAAAIAELGARATTCGQPDSRRRGD